MFKKLAFFTTVIMLASMVLGVVPSQAEYGACSDIEGGNVTFLVCQNYSIEHFWSGSKVTILHQNGVAADVAITNKNDDGYQNHLSLYLNSPQTVNVDQRDGQDITLTLTYLGQDNFDPNRALVKIDSNTTYEDSFYTPTPEPTPQPQPQPQPNPTLQAPTSVSVSSLYGTDPSKPLFDVSWNKVDNAEKFELYVEKQDSSNNYQYYFNFTDYVADLNSPDFTGVILPEKGKFRLKVRAIGNSLGSGPWSDYVSLTNVDEPQPQPQPQPGLEASSLTISQVYQDSNGDNFVDLTWTEVNGANYYKLGVDAQGNGFNSGSYEDNGYYLYDWRLGLTGHTLTYQLGSLGSPTNYRFKVMAYQNSASETNTWSNYAYASLMTMPQQPVVATPIITSPSQNQSFTKNKINFGWTTTGDGYEYTIDYYYQNNEWVMPIQQIIYTNTLSNVDLSPYLNYQGNGYFRIRVRAIDNSFNYSNWSDYTYFEIYNVNVGKLDKPTITFPTNNANIYHDKYDSFYYGYNIAERKLDTTWNSVSNANTYKVYYEYKDSQGQWVRYADLQSSTTSDRLYGWIDKGKYRVRVKAQDFNQAYDDSDWSDWVYFTVYTHEGKTSTSTTGVDGTYIGYKNLSISHTPSGITATVVNYDHAVVYLSLTGADSNLIYVKKGSSYYAVSQDGTKLLRFYYDKIDENGVTLRLETKNIVSP